MKFMHIAFFLLVLLGVGCTDAKPPIDSIPTYETFTIQSKEVGELRTINVWLPESYSSSKDSLPVLYMPDGGLKEDFPHIANTLSTLVKTRKIPALMLVGIENTERRRDVTGPTSVEKDKEIAPVVGGSAQFRQFISEELFAEIGRKYRTKNKKGIIGESLAGLFVTETFLLTPNLFDFYIAFDPSMWWNDKYLQRNATSYLKKFPADKKVLWFAGSSAEDISETVGLFADALKQSSVETIKWQYSNESKETHQTIFRACKEKALVWAVNEAMK